VKGELVFWGKKLHVLDASGAKAAFINKKIPSIKTVYTIEIGGFAAHEVTKEITLLKSTYTFRGSSWILTGDFLSHEYSLADRGREICRLSRKWFTWLDEYELEIYDPRDELVCLCTALVVACVIKAKRRRQ